MVALTDKLKRVAKPDPEALYEVVESFAVDRSVFRTGFRVRGDDPAVGAHPKQFMRADLDDVAKRKVRADYWSASYAQTAADTPKAPPPPRAVRPTGGMRSIGNFTVEEPELGGPRRLNAGTVVDASDPLYRAFPHLFAPHIEER